MCVHLKVCDTYGFSGTAEDWTLKRLLLPRGLGPPLWLDGAASVFGAPAVGKALGSPANLQEPALLKAHGSVT